MQHQCPQVSHHLHHGITAGIITVTMATNIQRQYSVAGLKGTGDTGHAQGMVTHAVDQHQGRLSLLVLVLVRAGVPKFHGRKAAVGASKKQAGFHQGGIGHTMSSLINCVFAD